MSFWNRRLNGKYQPRGIQELPVRSRPRFREKRPGRIAPRPAQFNRSAALKPNVDPTISAPWTVNCLSVLFDMDRLECARMLVAVMETGSFARAAERLRTSPGQASKLVSRLESELGVRLLNRTTRALAATEAGRPISSA
jgi:hypothetical protein